MKRGRPPGRAFGEVIRVRVQDDVHDALCREALRRGVSVSRVIRERLSVVTKTPEPQNAAH